MSYIKIQANQATVSASQNLLDFEIPEYIGGVDLNKSFINIGYTIDTTDTGLVGVHNFITMFNGIGSQSSNALFNSCLVRNVNLTGSRVGQLESIQRADLINQIKGQYTKNIGDIQGAQHESIMNLPTELNYGMNSARNLVTDGTMGTSADVTRYERTGVMRINLKDVLGLGSSVLNLNQLGSLRLHMEANLNKFTIKEVPCFTAATPPLIAGGHPNYWIDETTLPTTSANPTSITLGASAGSFLTKKNCPFHVGMKVKFVLTGSSNTPEEAVIKTMAWAKTASDDGPPIVEGGGEVTLTFSNAILDGVVVTSDITAIRMYPVYATTSALTYSLAELVVKSVPNPPMARGLQYRTFETIQDYANGNTTFNRTYEIPSNAVASLVCFDTAQSGTQFSNSFDAQINQYQLFVDNVGFTDRPVPIRTAAPFSKGVLHNIMLEKCLDHMGLPFKNNLDTVPKQINGAATLTDSEIIPESEIFTAETHNRVTVLPVIYQATGARKILNIDLQRDAVGENLNLAIFQHVERTINY